jgi:hypothetical protein
VVLPLLIRPVVLFLAHGAGKGSAPAAKKNVDHLDDIPF